MCVRVPTHADGSTSTSTHPKKLTRLPTPIPIHIVHNRYNTGRQELTLTTQRFLSRAHNKQYLVYLLENLVAEAKQQKPAGGH